MREDLIYEDYQIPEYKCHKIVKAVKIKSIEYNDSELFIVPEGDYDKIGINANYIAKHQPEIGGYFVIYNNDDGVYMSYSPPEPFEQGYTVLNQGKVMGTIE